MPKPQPHNFHVRLPEDVLSFLMDEKGGNSLNKEIVDRLRGSMARKEADSLADAIRPILETLGTRDRKELVALAIRALELLAKSRTAPAGESSIRHSFAGRRPSR